MEMSIQMINNVWMYAIVPVGVVMLAICILIKYAYQTGYCTGLKEGMCNIDTTLRAIEQHRPNKNC